MRQQVLASGENPLPAVIELAESEIATDAEKPANYAAFVVMVHIQMLKETRVVA